MVLVVRRAMRAAVQAVPRVHAQRAVPVRRRAVRPRVRAHTVLGVLIHMVHGVAAPIVGIKRAVRVVLRNLVVPAIPVIKRVRVLLRVVPLIAVLTAGHGPVGIRVVVHQTKLTTISG